MANARSHLVAIALTPTAAQIAEVKRSGARVQVLQNSTLVLTEDTGLHAPEALGEALAEHLRQHKYGCKHAVVGLCPRWVLGRHKRVPVADRDAMRGIVNLQIEREFAGSSAEMAFDYLLDKTSVDVDRQAPLLIAGVRRSVLEQALQVTEAAGLKVESVTPTTLAAAPGRSGTVVLVEQGVAGVMRVQGGVVVGLGSCPVGAGGLGDEATRSRFLSDLARSLLQLPGADDENGLTVLLPASASEADARALNAAAAERFGVVQCHAQSAAELLAGHATGADASLIDFRNSRLAPPKPQRLSSTARWLIRAAVIVLLIGGTAGYFWFDATSRRDALRAELGTIQDKADELDAIRKDTKLAEGWYDERPPTLDALLELTRTFPTEGAIRVETLTLSDDMTGQIECTAEDSETKDAYFVKMQQSKALLNVDPGSIRPSGGRNRWIDFPISFRFNPDAEGARR